MKCSVYISLFFFAAAFGNEEDLRRIDSIVLEEPCRRIGGICTVAADCPRGSLSDVAGLCPQQQQQGIECCFGVSLKETRCVKHGGSCMAPGEFCYPTLIFKGAEDCPDKYKCCILV